MRERELIEQIAIVILKHSDVSKTLQPTLRRRTKVLLWKLIMDISSVAKIHTVALNKVRTSSYHSKIEKYKY